MQDVAHRWSSALGIGLAALMGVWTSGAAAQQAPPPIEEAAHAAGDAGAPTQPEPSADPASFAARVDDLVVDPGDVHSMDWEEYRAMLRDRPDSARELAPQMLLVDPDAPAEWACLGCHEAQIDAHEWKNALHRERGFTCRHCHEQAGEVPHPEGMPTPQCEHCHDGMASIRSGAETSAHGPQGPGAANDCAGCHDPHSMSESGASAEEMVSAGCRECHDRSENLVEQHADFLCATELHLAKVGCMYCHLEGSDSEAVHNVKFGEAAAAVACTDCHGKDSLLGLADEVEEDAGLLRIQNRRLEREKGYLIGANRIVGLDIAIILLVLGACCFPIGHGGLRILFRRSR